MATRQPKICVVGSINMDLIVETQTMPQQGETIIGQTFETYPGGKGANQAVAASRLGADVAMIGALGADDFGETLRQHLQQEKINTDGIVTIPDQSSGIANIIVSEQDNRIIVISGANQSVTPEVVNEQQHILLNSDIVLLQFEIPMATIEHTVKLANDHNIPTIVNPAPFHKMSDELLDRVTYMTPNEIEAAALKTYHSNKRQPEKLITTKGANGVSYFGKDSELVHVPAFDVTPIDTTGAGDTFNGALAVSLSEGHTLEDSITFANRASALSILSIGAQNGMPTREIVEASHLI